MWCCFFYGVMSLMLGVDVGCGVMWIVVIGWVVMMILGYGVDYKLV